MGSAMDNGSYSNSYSAELLNCIPPLFPGILTTAQTFGFADSNTLGSTATSSMADASTVEVYLSTPLILLFSTTYSITGSVSPHRAARRRDLRGRRRLLQWPGGLLDLGDHRLVLNRRREHVKCEWVFFSRCRFAARRIQSVR